MVWDIDRDGGVMRDGVYEFDDGNSYLLQEMQGMRQAQHQAGVQAAAAARPSTDPLAQIRNLRFQTTPEFRPLEAEEWRWEGDQKLAAPGAVMFTDPDTGAPYYAMPTGGGFAAPIDEQGLSNFRSLLGGFESKYNTFRLRPDGKIEGTLQQPGAHKYDTMTAVWAPGEDGQWVLENDPFTMPTRQVSSRERYKDIAEKVGGLMAIMGTAGVAGGALGTGALSKAASSALIQGGVSGVATEAQGGDFMEGFGRGAVSGAVGSGLGSLVSPALGGAGQAVSEAVGGGTLGNVAGSAVTGAGTSALGAALRGNNSDEILDALVAGGVSGGVGAGVSDLVGGMDLPAPASRLLTGALTDAALGADTDTVLNRLQSRGLGELIRYASTPAASGFQGLAGTRGDQPGDYDMPTNPQTPRWWESLQTEPEAYDPISDYLRTGGVEGSVVGGGTGGGAGAVGPGFGNLETDFFVTDRGPIVDSAGNQGRFVDGNWVVGSMPPEYAPAPAPRAPAPRAAAPRAPAAPPAPAPTARPRGRSSDDLLALAAMMGGQRQSSGPAPYASADVSSGVQAGLAAIERMFGRG